MQLVGQQIGRYKIRSAIGVGGMGEVFLAEDSQLRRPVALKFLPLPFLENEDRLRRFEREAFAVAALNHPNIAHIYEVGESDGHRFIAMEYIDGITLAEAIRRYTPLGKLLKYLTQVADALAKAHAVGIVHRDLKPDNIMIAHDGYAKILDFGLAKLIRPQTYHHAEEPGFEESDTVKLEQESLPGMILGTVGYMSPEQARGKTSEVDHRSDIFSFGCILYESISGQRAFEGEDLIDSLHKIIHSNPPSLSELQPNLSPELQRIVRRCLVKDPGKRYQSIKDVAIELEEFQESNQLAQSYFPDRAGGVTKSGLRVTQDPGAGVPPTVISGAVSGTSPTFGRIVKIAGMALAALLLLIGSYLIYLWLQPPPARSSFKITPMTNSPHPERNPSLSPDEKQMAYVWAGENNDNFDIYVRILDAGTPLRLTTSTEKEMSPVWSPDGRYIAFMRGTGDTKGFYIIPALGGPERKLGDSFGYAGLGVLPHAVDWSPDGKFLAVRDKLLKDDPFSIFLISVDSGERRQLTNPPPQTNGDVIPAFSPDGRSLAFARTNANMGDLHVVSVDGGEPTPLTFNYSVSVRGIDWTSDGKSLVFSAGYMGTPNLWIMPAAGGEAVAIAGVGENVGELSVSRDGDKIAYAQYTMDTNLWRMEVSNDSSPKGSRPAPQKLIPSTRLEETPQFSPDGQKIVFSSNSSGRWQIWVSDSEGRNLTPLTHLEDAVPGNPRWSPDGRHIAFDLREAGNSDIYIIDAGGGTPRPVTTEPSHETMPNWSRDGTSIYFSSNRSGKFEVWKMPAGGGEAVQITKQGGSAASESVDGRLLFYLKDPDEAAAFISSISPLWVVSPGGGEETPVITERIGRRWAIVQGGIYFLVPLPGNRSYSVNHLDLATMRRSEIGIIEGGERGFHVSSLTASPDERWLVYAQRDQLDYDIMLVENFR